MARHNFESKRVLDDAWLSMERRCRATVLYVEIGKDFNKFLQWLGGYPPRLRYNASVWALETFRDNMDEAWHYAYSGILREMVWLREKIW